MENYKTWEEIKESITFLEILDEILKQHFRKVRVEHEFLMNKEPSYYAGYHYLNDLLWKLGDDFNSPIVAAILVNGKFYLE